MCRKYQAVKLREDTIERRKELKTTRKIELNAKYEEIRKDECPRSLFGIPYDVASAWSSTIILGIPDLITYCCARIDCSDYDEEGLFRLSASKSNIDKYVEIFNANKDLPPFSEFRDIDTAAGIVKKFIRELPESPFRGPISSDDTPQTLLERMPIDLRMFVQMIFYIFHKVALNKEVTKMGYSNLMIVTPTLLPKGAENIYRAYVEDYDTVFNPEDLPLPKNWPHIF